MTGRRIRTFCRGITGLILLVVLTLGLPLALYKFGGSPIPRRLPSLHEVTSTLIHKDNGGLFLGAVRDVSWIAWFAFTVAVLAEAQAAIRGRRAPRLHLAGLQGMAGRLVALAALTFSAPAAVSLIASPAMAATVQSATPVASHGSDSASASASSRMAVAHRVIVVRPGDCLWTIAEHYLGAGDRFTEIVQLNMGHQMGAGQVFTDPSLILPGWHLRLPDAAGNASPRVAHNGHDGRNAGGQHEGHPSAHHRFSHSHQPAGGAGGTAGTGAGGTAGTGANGTAGTGAGGTAGTGANGTAGTGAGGTAGTGAGGTAGTGAGGTAGTGAGGTAGTGAGGTAGTGAGGTAGTGAGGTARTGAGNTGGGTRSAGGGSAQAAGAAGERSGSADTRDQMAEAALFSLGMLAGAVLASLDRLRHRQRQERRPGRRIALPADPAGRRIEQKLRAAAARWPIDRAGAAGDDGDDDDFFRPQPDLDDEAFFGRASGFGDDDFCGDEDRGDEDRGLEDRGHEDRGDEDRRGDGGFRDDNAFNVDDGYDRDNGYDRDDGYDRDNGYDRDDGYGIDNGYDGTGDAGGEGALGEHARFARAESIAAPGANVSLALLEQHQRHNGAGSQRAPGSLREALRDLSEGIAVAGEPLPPIVGIHLTSDTLDVLLSAPAATPPPAPFVIAPARQAMCWTVQLTGEAGVAGGTVQPPAPGEVGDLLPGLFTAGATQAGGYLLLDLEAMRVTCCNGPDDLADRLLVTAATELASSQWSGWYDLVLAGFDELDVLGRAEHCSGLEQALSLLEQRAHLIARRISDSVASNGGPADVRTRRMADPEDEDWGLTLLVSRERPTPGQMSRLLDLADGPGGIAALVAGDTQTDDGKLAPAVFQLAPDPDREDEIVATITLAYLGPNHQITVWPQTLTAIEYEAMAGVFATAADTGDVAADDEPYGDFGAPPWIRLAAAPVPPVADMEPAPTPVSGQAPRHAAPSLQVKVLGPVEIVGTAEPLMPKQAELLLALALHAPAGVSNSGLCTLLGADADHPKPADSVRQLITRTRKRLGQAPDGREFIVHLGSGIYVPHPGLQMDWTAFSTFARRGRADRRREDLRAAMALVRGEPFADCYHWWIEVSLIETIRAEIVDTAELLAQLELAAGDPRAAVRAARSGLAAESAAEQLWRALMRAEFESGNFDGVTAAWTGCLDAISEIAPGGEPHPDTEQLFHRLARGAPIGIRH
ncbi:MAG TPA: BTAD domain-containing putative transcriptional regulator [Streptosporangiaceae bacterium]|nr:BTAD domain-containing putative transcriptional regulator [Streptosporangiaceae bacterium]